MQPHEHYAQAERLLRQAADQEFPQATLQYAQAHATLATAVHIPEHELTYDVTKLREAGVAPPREASET